MNLDRSVLVVALLALAVALGSLLLQRRDAAEFRNTQRELGSQLAELRLDLSAAQAAVGIAPAWAQTGTQSETAPTPFVEELAALRERVEAVAAMSSASPSEQLIESFERLEWKGRAKALEDLAGYARSGDAEARRAVVGALRDANARVREEAVKAIAESGDPDLFAELAPLVDDPDLDVRKELADSLEDAPAATAGPLLMRMLDDENLEVVEDAVKALGKLQYAPARTELADLFDPAYPRLTGAAAEALRDLGDAAGADAGVAVLGGALENPDPEVRRRAVKEIGQIGGESAISSLERALDDPDPGVASEARKRLERLGHSGA